MFKFLSDLFSFGSKVDLPKYEPYVPQYESTSNSTTIVITTEKQPVVKPKAARKAPVRRKKETPSSSD